MVDMMLVGEAWGTEEAKQHLPFVGTAGFILDQMLSQVGITRRDCYLTNVFNLQPKPSNDIKNLCGVKATALPEFPALIKGKYIRAEYANHLDRLYEEIKTQDPNIVVALGATASWALLHSTGIKNIRGAVATTPDKVTARLGRPFKVLPTYHPAAIARQWSDRPVCLSDLDKAKRESDSPEVRRPAREIWTAPNLLDLATFEREHILPASILSVDIETWGNQITCIGFAPSPQVALVIPFILNGGKSYWATGEELTAWNYIRRWLATKKSLFQNGMYDIQFLWRSYGIPVPLAAEDTMLLHHAWQPEMQKGLGFLASLYTDEASWKHMRKGANHD
jgi:uracil-DNA glycosylase